MFGGHQPWYDLPAGPDVYESHCILTPFILRYCVSVYNQYVIRVSQGDELVARLREQECFRHLGYRREDCACASDAARSVLALPVYPELTRAMQDYVIDGVLTAMREPTTVAESHTHGE